MHLIQDHAQTSMSHVLLPCGMGHWWCLGTSIALVIVALVVVVDIAPCAGMLPDDDDNDTNVGTRRQRIMPMGEIGKENVKVLTFKGVYWRCQDIYHFECQEERRIFC